MITIIHGDDIVASRKFLNEEKSKAENTKTFSGSYLLTDIIQTLEGSLFEGETSVFIENLLGKKKNTEKEEIISYLSKNASLANMYIWEDTEIPVKTLQVFKTAQNKLFKLPKLLFTFVDSLKPETGKNLIVLFHQLLDQTDADFVFAMIIRQFRLLIAISEDDSIDEVKRLSPWQIAKIKKQKLFFTEEQLLLQHNKLFSIDSKLKTGTLSLSLIQAIDFFLSDL